MALALYRRYRPQTFQAVAGQTTVVKALCHALDTQRLHHAYLFTGTRGVGKTTLARLLAKALNCIQGVSSTPCGVCDHCEAITKGCFPDLLEIDAASRTKVEDTRELLDNVQYLPVKGRYKVYLIDEVHMLSGHSFNALLKTLEEPPKHVIFLLATTDPQKLPVTVLSRCLQFHLPRVSIIQIVGYLQYVLAAEGGYLVSAEALALMAGAAEGSVRDALTLLEQALSYGDGTVGVEEVRQMLGLVEKSALVSLLQTIVQGDPRLLMNQLKLLAETGLDYAGLLRQFLEMIHQLCMAHFVPEIMDTEIQEKESMLSLSQQPAESLQLYYQMALNTQRDLPYAPSPQLGFEMGALRMMAFQPVVVSAFKERMLEKNVVSTLEEKSAVMTSVPVSEHPEKITVPERLTTPPVAVEQKKHDLGSEIPEWHRVVRNLNISGLTRVLAEHCVVEKWSESNLILIVDSAKKPLLNQRHQDRLQEALSQYFSKTMTLKIHDKPEKSLSTETPALRQVRVATEQHHIATQQTHQDPRISEMLQAFDANIESISVVDVS
jgi:DNA polymerase III subunit gamma/tau